MLDFSKIPAIAPRKTEFEFTTAIPRAWLHGDPVATSFVNALNLIFPLGERFFVRSVKHYLDQLSNEDLKRQVRGFFGQEGRHAHEHERFFEVLRAQGYDIDSFLEFYGRKSRAIEELLPPELNLAITAACEHFTAIMGEYALTDRFIEGAHPEMQALLKWHAAEEIEHKAVAFDVLQEVDGRYAVRMLGLALGTGLLLFFWMRAFRALLEQEGLDRKQVQDTLRVMRRQNPFIRRVFLRGIREFVRPNFHPSNHDNFHLARDHFASVPMVTS